MVNTIEEEGMIITIIEVTDPIIEIGVNQEITMGIEEMIALTMDIIIEGTILDRTMVTKGIEIEV